MADWLAPYVGLLESVADRIAESLDGAEVGLFASNHTPVLADTESTYAAIEAAWGGYARQTASPWTGPAIDGSDRAVTYSSLLVFPVTADPAGAVVYGYFVVKGATLLWAEKIVPTITPVEDVPVSLIARYFHVNQ